MDWNKWIIIKKKKNNKNTINLLSKPWQSAVKTCGVPQQSQELRKF